MIFGIEGAFDHQQLLNFTRVLFNSHLVNLSAFDEHVVLIVAIRAGDDLLNGLDKFPLTFAFNGG